uniref:G-protein coupled receptors family 1 profile domain-containing protein n=1 Tax=Electrophorus electricus TaxID=8005 RepID=A0A4W4DM26_ELEEL
MPPPLRTAEHDYNFPALIFGILLIIVIICGNVLVCLSVHIEKALKTTTNYFIVSLAVADLLLAILVLPLFVYAEVSNQSLRYKLCREFIAVTVPLHYSRKRIDHRQLFLLSATWLLALAVALPVIFGINNVPQRDPAACQLEVDSYVVYSSVCSFFIPCPIMLLLYCGTFRGLRRWEEVRRAKLRSSILPCRQLQYAAALQAPGSLLPCVMEQDLAQTTSDQLDGDMQPSCPLPPKYSNSPIRTLTYAEIQSAGQKRKRAKINSRERKAMGLLPVIVGAFLLCWTPFFVVHSTRAVCQTCAISPHLMSTVTWLGYVNSALNPVIYTVFNADFRKVFHKFLHSCC